MKTTFKNAFANLDDELMNTEVPCISESVDVDIDKIKEGVLMRINNTESKKKSKKRIITLLVAAVILVSCTIGVVATGSVRRAFGSLFTEDSNLNNLGLYDGENVVVNTTDDTLNIKLLGITGDEHNIYSAIEITRKDGSFVIDKDYSRVDTSAWNKVKIQAHEKDTGTEVMAGETRRFEMSQDKKTITLYLTHYIVDGDMQDSRVTVSCEGLNAYRIGEELASVDLPKVQEEEERVKFLAECDRISKEIEDEDGWIEVDYDGKRHFVKGDRKYFELPFEISYDVKYGDEQFIERSLDCESAPGLVEDFAQNVSVEITPFGAYLYAECEVTDENMREAKDQEIECFRIGEIKDSKVIMDDGTIYYLGWHPYCLAEYDEETGVYTRVDRLKLFRYPGYPYHNEDIVIDTRNIYAVTINGELIYSK